jgi:hypothetical protein
MAEVPGSFVHYLAAWNERDPELTGMDCTTVDDEGRITRLDGFFGEFPPIESG